MPKRLRENSSSVKSMVKKMKTSHTNTKTILAAVKRARAGEERKYLETRLNNAEPGAGGSVISLDAIAEGTDFNQRVGRKIRSLYLQYNISVVTTITASTNQSFPFSVYFVLDRQPNGTVPTVGQILDTSVVPAPYAMKNIQLFEERFKILKHHVGLSSGFGASQEDAMFSGYIDLTKIGSRDEVMHFAGSAAAEPNTNGLYCLIATDDGTATFVNFNGGIRYVYEDM